MKISNIVLFVYLVSIQVYAQFIDDDEGEGGYAPPTCPDNGLSYYKNCRGSLDECSTCLGNAERECEKAFGKNTCYGCTTRVAGNCDSVKDMCFGKQECTSRLGSDYKCIDYACVYSP